MAIQCRQDGGTSGEYDIMWPAGSGMMGYVWSSRYWYALVQGTMIKVHDD